MRTIKFRAWDNVNNVMKDWNYIGAKFDISDLFGNSRFTPMQFTGLLDKNKVEVYEGDIIETPMGNIIEVFFGEKVYRFGRDEIQCFGWVARKISNGHVETFDDSLFGKITGNIHETQPTQK